MKGFEHSCIAGLGNVGDGGEFIVSIYLWSEFESCLSGYKRPPTSNCLLSLFTSNHHRPSFGLGLGSGLVYQFRYCKRTSSCLQKFMLGQSMYLHWVSL
jgi:hypothetical protein